MVLKTGLSFFHSLKTFNGYTRFSILNVVHFRMVDDRKDDLWWSCNKSHLTMDGHSDLDPEMGTLEDKREGHPGLSPHPEVPGISLRTLVDLYKFQDSCLSSV